MSGATFLGIDAGTTRIKAALIDFEGNTIDIIGLPVPVMNPFDGACEINMNALWEEFCVITKELAKRNPECFENIAGIGITGQGDGMWPIDKDGEPVRNAILWNDTRTKYLTIKNIDKINEACIKNCVTPIFAGGPNILLKWLQVNERENYDKTAWVLHCKDWLNYKLTGQIKTDYSDASTALINVFNKKYVWEIFDLLGLEDYERRFPDIVASTDIVGTVTKTASLKAGIKEGIPVIAGALDIAAVGLGVGSNKIGDACTILGTTLGNTIILEKSQVDHSDTKGSALCHIIPENYIRLMGALSGTSTLDWVRSILVPDMNFAEIEENIKCIPIGSEGVMYHPYIYGERAPFRNPFACGGFNGLNSRHNKYHMVRAAYEGLVLSLYDCYQSLPEVNDCVYVSGGGSESDFLCSMVADCLGKTILRSSIKELGINGIVMTLKVGLGYTVDFSQHNVKSIDRFEPNMENHLKFQNIYRIFQNLKISMEGYWNERANLLNSNS